MFPHLPLGAMDEVADFGLISGKFCLSNTEDISPDVFHVKKDIEEISGLVAEGDAIYVLQVYTNDFAFPFYLGLRGG